MQLLIPDYEDFLEISQEDWEEIVRKYPFLETILLGKYSNNVRVLVQAKIDFLQTGDISQLQQNQQVQNASRALTNYVPTLVNGIINMIMQAPEQNLPIDVDQALQQ
uniref:Uncharacterized protein n=1 Tax=Acrobeloides nanus TaxID=290746 RepID=A0A914D0I9_9BILA